jgi:hypothetical protein
MTPMATNTLSNGAGLLLEMAVLLPLVVGIAARVLWFRRDADDVHLRSAKTLAETLKESDMKWSRYDPEPDPVWRNPWPEFTAALSEVPAVEPAPEPVPELAPEPTPEPNPLFIYKGAGLDLETVRGAVDNIWTRLKSDRTNPVWRLAPGAFENAMPYMLGGAQGADPRTATLRVGLADLADPSERDILASLWSDHILPELRQHFGANAFKSE